MIHLIAGVALARISAPASRGEGGGALLKQARALGNSKHKTPTTQKNNTAYKRAAHQRISGDSGVLLVQALALDEVPPKGSGHTLAHLQAGHTCAARTGKHGLGSRRCCMRPMWPSNLLAMMTMIDCNDS